MPYVQAGGVGREVMGKNVLQNDDLVVFYFGQTRIAALTIGYGCKQAPNVQSIQGLLPGL